VRCALDARDQRQSAGHHVDVGVQPLECVGPGVGDPAASRSAVLPRAIRTDCTVAGRTVQYSDEAAKMVVELPRPVTSVPFQW